MKRKVLLFTKEVYEPLPNSQWNFNYKNLFPSVNKIAIQFKFLEQCNLK